MLKKSLLLMAVFCFLVTNFSAQSATTDTLEQGKSYAEVNAFSGVQSHQNGGSQIYGGRFSYGLTKKVEVGINGSFSNPNDVEYPPEIQPNIKWKFYQSEKHNVTMSGGAILFLPIAKRAGTDTFTMFYANVSKQVKRFNGAKLTVGGYSLAGRDKSFGSRQGWNFNYEQPLTNKISFSTQWVTGKNRFGYVTPGFSVALPKNSSLFVGYSIGNYDYDNHGPYLSVGKYW